MEGGAVTAIDGDFAGKPRSASSRDDGDGPQPRGLRPVHRPANDGSVITTFFESIGGFRPWTAIGSRHATRATVDSALPALRGQRPTCAPSTGTNRVNATSYEVYGGWRPVDGYLR